MSSSPENIHGRLLWQTSSEDSSDSENENRVKSPRAPRNFRRRVDHFTRWNDEEFRVRFRLSKETVTMLEQRLHVLTPKTERNYAVTAMQQILLVLRFCATGCMLQTVGDFTGIHKTTACRIVKRVIGIFASLAAEYIHMPNTQEEIDEVKTKFYTIAKFPRVIGAIDCTHVKIISPGGANAEYFRNRKGYFSINVQVVADPNLLIRNIVARWPGSTHDQTILNNSSIKAQFENNRFGNSVMLGDSGYALKKYLITPIVNPTTEVEQVFNESQIRSRNPVERLFGVLKRFPVLSLGMIISGDSTDSYCSMCSSS
ncbi:unnamed protein product [Acanthoscelides obtectus]|uniref:DDE Tnp4 domain-containing protein n=2 Tax=Acanthoscelides obtectus TaxID=200917 RepID=A0A9P0PID6_ACAOB|nr:unnamed protein product [Acanthoscelides obtectus]CAK1656106.1 Putative nuclease HARBI1 [Acanthoscelides obtectus]